MHSVAGSIAFVWGKAFESTMKGLLLRTEPLSGMQDRMHERSQLSRHRVFRLRF